MRLAKVSLLLTALLLGSAGAHIGGTLYPFYEIPDEALATLNLRDGSLADWESLLGAPSATAAQFAVLPGTGDSPPYNPTDLDFRIWWGWNQSTNRIYAAIERRDDVYINTYPGGDPANMW